MPALAKTAKRRFACLASQTSPTTTHTSVPITALTSATPSHSQG
jgi:hypothetical protein